VVERDEHGAVIGVFADAFGLRPRESYLSSIWVEYFVTGDLTARLPAVLAALRVFRDVRRRDALAVCNVGKIVACGDARGRRVRVWNEPKPDCPSYAAIRGTDNDERELLEMLANEALAQAVEVRSIERIEGE
jgi:hypothetical protein